MLERLRPSPYAEARTRDFVKLKTEKRLAEKIKLKNPQHMTGGTSQRGSQSNIHFNTIDVDSPYKKEREP